MPLGTPSLFGFGAGENSAATASATPTANATLVAFVGARMVPNGTLPTLPTCSGGSLTWTSQGSFSFSPASGAWFRLRVFTATVGGSPSAMTVTGASTTSVGVGIAVFQITGAGSDFSNIDFGTTEGGDPSVTLPSAPAGTSAVLGYAICSLNNAYTTATLDEVFDTNFGTTNGNFRHTAGYDNTSPATTNGWTSSNGVGIGAMLEVKVAGGEFTGTMAATESPVATIAGNRGQAGSLSVTAAVTASFSGAQQVQGTLTGTIVPTATMASNVITTGIMAAIEQPKAIIAGSHGGTSPDPVAGGLPDGDVALSAATAPFYFSQLTRASRVIIWIVEIIGDAVSRTSDQNTVFMPVPVGAAPEGAPVTGEEVLLVPHTFRYASRSFYTQVSDTPSNQFYDGRLSPVTISKTIGHGQGGIWAETASTEVGVITLTNRDGLLDDLSERYVFEGRQLTIKVAGIAQDAEGRDTPPALADFTTVFVGEIEGWLATRDVVNIKIRDASAALDRPLAQDQYLGHGGSAGLPELAGVSKPVAFGECRNVPAVEVDSSLLIYQLHYREMRSVDDVFDMGVRLRRAKTVATYADLEGLRVEGGETGESAPDLLLGQYAVCTATGHFRLAGIPEGLVTADIHGDGGSISNNEPFDDLFLFDDGFGWFEEGQTRPYMGTAARIIFRILRDFAHIPDNQISATQLAQIDNETNVEAGYYLAAGDNNTTCREAIAALSATIGCFLDRDNVGRYGLTRLSPPLTDPVLTIDEGLTQRDGGGETLERLDLPYGRPWPSWRIAHTRNWRPMQENELAPLADPVRRAFCLRRSNEIEVSDPIMTLLYPGRGFGVLDGVSVSETKAATRGLERLSLYAPGRSLFRAHVKGISFRLRLGDIVAMTHKRHGLRSKTYLRFDGLNTNAMILPPSSRFLPSTTSVFTVALWVRLFSIPTTTDPVDNRIITFRSGADVTAFGIHADNTNRLRLRVTPTNTTVFTGLILQKWYHVAVSYNGAIYSTYMDGSLISSLGPSTEHGAGTSANAIMGGLDEEAQGSLDGHIDDFRFYDRVLTPGEVSQIHNAGAKLKTNAGQEFTSLADIPGLKMHINPQAVTSDGFVPDMSDNGNSGFLSAEWTIRRYELPDRLRKFLVMGVQEDARSHNTSLLLWG